MKPADLVRLSKKYRRICGVSDGQFFAIEPDDLCLIIDEFSCFVRGTHVTISNHSIFEYAEIKYHD
jgi:hypothetical protein